MTIDSSPSPEREELLDEPTDPGMPLVAQRRAAGALLVAGSAIFWLAEFIAAAAWTDPPYSYTYHYISDLGVRGPSTAFDQYMYSPLAWVMNTGFFLFGIVLFAGVAMLRGWRVVAGGCSPRQPSWPSAALRSRSSTDPARQWTTAPSPFMAWAPSEAS